MNSLGEAVNLHNSPSWVSPIKVASGVKLGTACLKMHHTQKDSCI